jgi:hypothetical protein
MNTVCGLLACLLLGACSPATFPSAYVPPSPPTPQAVIKGARVAAAEEKLTGPIEISEVRLADHGPGSYFVCLREASSSDRRTAYSAFWDNDAYKGVRHSAILEACASQTYSPVSEQPPSAMTAKPVR